MEASVQLDYRGKPRSKYQTVNDLPSLTVQSDADRADIRKILAKYKQTGLVTELNRAEARFVDVTAFTDYADLMRNVKAAEVEFMKLPARIRKIFHNDVSEWLDAAHDPDKREALVEAGFIAPEVPKAPVEPVSEPPSDASE